MLAVISDGLSVSQAAQKVGVSRQTLHSWLARYEAEGIEGAGGSVASAADIHAAIRNFVHTPRRIDAMLGYLQGRTRIEYPAAA